MRNRKELLYRPASKNAKRFPRRWRAQTADLRDAAVRYKKCPSVPGNFGRDDKGDHSMKKDVLIEIKGIYTQD